MLHTVGPRGQVVISKELRDRLGVQPGWIALERLVDDHIEIRFLPPPHHDSLKGSLSAYVTRSVATEDEWDRARETAWEAAAWERETGFLRETGV